MESEKDATETRLLGQQLAALNVAAMMTKVETIATSAVTRCLGLGTAKAAKAGQKIGVRRGRMAGASHETIGSGRAVPGVRVQRPPRQVVVSGGKEKCALT